jgi:hypothetical protein
VALVIKRLAAQAGMEAKDLAGHSLRAGLAIVAARKFANDFENPPRISANVSNDFGNARAVRLRRPGSVRGAFSRSN